MDYANFSALLPPNITFSKYEITTSAKRLVHEEPKELLPIRRYSNLSEIVNQQNDNWKPQIMKKLLLSEESLKQDKKFNPELI